MRTLGSVSLKTKMMLAFASIIALSVTAAGVGVVGFHNTQTAQSIVANQGVPVITAAQQLAGLTTNILQIPPVLRRAETNEARHAQLASLQSWVEAVESKLDDLQARNFEATLVLDLRQTIAGITDKIGLLDANLARSLAAIKAVDNHRRLILHALNELTELSATLSADASTNTKKVLSSLYDRAGDTDQVARTIDGLLDDNIPQAERMAGLRSASLTLIDIANRLAREADARAVPQLKKEFEAAFNDLGRSVDTIDDPARLLTARKDLIELRRNSFNPNERNQFSSAPSYSNERNLFVLVDEVIRLHADLDGQVDSIAQTSSKVFALLDKVVIGSQSTIANAIADAERVVTFSQRLMVSLTALALVVTGLIMWLIVHRTLLRRLSRLELSMLKLANGDLTVELADRRSDELGKMAAAVRVFRENAAAVHRLQAEQTETKRRAEEARQVAMQTLADSFETSMQVVVNAVSSSADAMQTSAQTMSTTSVEASRQATMVAAAAEQASSHVQTIAASTEQLSASISEISRQVINSANICHEAVTEAATTRGSVQSMEEAAQRIGAVVTLISNIASQTNLLALNATIEAARAGEAGKGFAVVASEVKSLATQTAKATEEIRLQIDAVQLASTGTFKAMEHISSTISRVSDIAVLIASAVEQQGAATQEIARGVQQAALGTQEIFSNISGVSRATSETGTNATVVLGATNELSQQSDMLRAEVDRFLTTIRSA